jgi:hypothetical protein
MDVISPGNSETRQALDEILTDRQIDGYPWIAPGNKTTVRPRLKRRMYHTRLNMRGGWTIRRPRDFYPEPRHSSQSDDRTS